MANATTSASISSEKSTIVRANIAFRLRGMALALTEREAPRLGARLAVRMWLTIPPAAIRPAVTEPGERTVLRGRIVTESWGAGPAVYLLHGWGGYRGQLGSFVEPLTSAGFRVVAVDAPGHGESGPGRYGRGRALMPDFISALKAAIAHYGPAHGVVAHSLGASATAIAVLDGLPVNRLVLIAPVSNAMSGIDIFARTAGIGPRVRAQMPRRIQRLTRIPVQHFDVVTRSAERDELPPALVIHDTGDRRVPFDLGVLVAAAWPGARLEPTEGLGHLRILQRPEVTKSAAGFLAGVPVGGRQQPVASSGRRWV
jgi:pimeloyl-ACP methyl ester carboxylesterase